MVPAPAAPRRALPAARPAQVGEQRLNLRKWHGAKAGAVFAVADEAHAIWREVCQGALHLKGQPLNAARPAHPLRVMEQILDINP
jgi:hypothetical protein